MKLAFCVFNVALTVCLVNVVGLPTPKDSTVVVAKDVPVYNVNEEKPGNEDITKVSHLSDVVAGRVWCQHEGEEPTEDGACQGHCIPKGYSYGLCVRNTCSCI